MDTLTPEQRHEIMSRIRGKDTNPEKIVRLYLFARGLRYRKNDRRLPGHPDLVFPKYKTVVFINGCFWHGHDCSSYRFPKTNQEYWKAKIESNMARDRRTKECLESSGWKVITVWECFIKTVAHRNQTLPLIYRQIVQGVSE